METQKTPWILGLNFSHNGSACLMNGDKIVVAIQEERLNGVKNARIEPFQPLLAIKYCLNSAGITIEQLDYISFSSQISNKECLFNFIKSPLFKNISKRPKILFIPHHLGHALSVYCTSGYEESVVMVIDKAGSPKKDLLKEERDQCDGTGEDDREYLSGFFFKGSEFEVIDKHLMRGDSDAYSKGYRLPEFYSLGGMYSSVARLLFGSEFASGKVMGLAAFGHPKFCSDYFYEFKDGRFSFRDKMSLFIEEFEEEDFKSSPLLKDIASSVQSALEEAVFELLEGNPKYKKSRNFCFSGGCALNSVLNEKIVNSHLYDRVHVLSASDDSGVALGAAFYAYKDFYGELPRVVLKNDFFGNNYTRNSDYLDLQDLPGVEKCMTSPEELSAEVARLLSQDKIVGWFKKGAELGPRALGHRSILLNPAMKDGKNILNSKVKYREAFRPFAPAIIDSQVSNWFDGHENYSSLSSFMLRVSYFKKEKLGQVPSVTHFDGTGRLQVVTEDFCPEFYELIQNFFSETGVPILLNTSFNLMGEPIVETPEDAIWSMLCSGIEYCVVGDDLFKKSIDFKGILSLAPELLIDLFKDCTYSEDKTSADASVESRWGVFFTKLGERELFVLSQVDGKRSGHEIFKKFLQEYESSTEVDLIKLLNLFRRKGIISFRP